MKMNSQDFRTLKILEEIEKEVNPSQRYLAKKMNISIGLVNSFLKRLAQKGYFKITTIPKNRIKYILTPKGAAEKIRLTYEYIHQSYRFYNITRKNLTYLFGNLASKGIQNIAFFGVSDLAEIAYLSVQESLLNLTGIFDEKLYNQSFFHLNVKSPLKMSDSNFDLILITAIISTDEIKRKIIEYKISEDKIIIPNN